MKNLEKLMSILLESAAILLLTAGISNAQENAGPLFEKALYAEEMKGDLAEAVTIYQQILKENPGNRQVSARALLHIGMCYEKLGSEQARLAYQDVISKYSDQSLEVSMARERITHLEAFTAELNREAEKHMKNGNELFKRWEYESAIKEYENAIKSGPNTQLALTARYCIGQSWFRAGKYDAALVTFTKLIEENPESNIAPVSELMVDQVKHSMENDKSQAKQINSPDENTIVDPGTGIKYTKIRSFIGKNDQINSTWGGFNISPDGRFMVKENKVVPVDGSDAFDLVEMDALRAIYSPGMKKAAFYADSAIWTVPVSAETGRTTGKPEKLVTGRYKYQFPVSWSPDGERLVFGKLDNKIAGDIWIVNVTDSKQVSVTNSPDLEHQPVWSPDGKLIVYEKERNLWLTNIDGSETRMIIQSATDPHWSSDTKWLFNNSQRINYLYSLDRNKNFKFTTPVQVGDLGSFSPDGKKVLFYRSSSDMKWPLKIVSSAGGPPFSPLLNTDVYDSYWLKDSKRMLALTANDQGYKLFSVTGGPSEEIKIEANVNGKPNPFMFSDDLTQVAFSVRREDGLKNIYIAPFSMTEARTTGPAQMVFEGWSGGAYNVLISWSRDGKKLAVVHEGDIWVVQTDGGKPVKITNTPETERWVSFSPDGNLISYFIPSVQEGILHIIPTSGGTSKVLNKDCQGATWFNDSKNIVLLSNNNLQVISLDGQKTKHLLNIKDIGLSNDGIQAQLSPDGKYLAFIGYIGDNDHCLIITYSMETGKITRLADENLIDNKYGLVWSPDGKWLSYLTYEEEKVRPEGSLWEADFEEIKEKLTKE
jgi:Tol biopolymer transport system component/TolA-binding protein